MNRKHRSIRKDLFIAYPGALRSKLLSKGVSAGIVFFILTVFTSPSIAQLWSSLGPTNEAGVMRGLQLHQTTNRLFASAHDGGLWVTDLDDASPTWSPISDFLDNIEIRAFAVSPSNSQVIYAANNALSVYRSGNGGTTWVKLTGFDQSFGRVHRLVVPFDRPNAVLAATATGLYRSENSGSTWTLVRTGDIRDIAIDPSFSAILYIGIRGDGVYRSTNGGATWIEILNWTYTPSTNFNFTPPRTTPSQTIKISLGDRRSPTIPETPAIRTVAVKFGRHIWVSRNGGVTFENKDSPLITANDAGNYLRSEEFVDDEWCNAIGVDPFNSNRILVGQVSLFMTTDGGTNWIEFNTTASPNNDNAHEDFQDFAFSRNVQNLIFAANDGGVERSTAANPTFSTFYTGLVTSQLFRVGVSGNAVVANSDHNGVLGNTQISDGTWAQAISRACGYGNNGMERSDIHRDPKRPNRFYFFFDQNPPIQIGRLIFPYASGNNCVGNATQFAPFRPFLIGGLAEKPQQSVAVDTRANSQLILVASDVERINCSNWLICPDGPTTFDLMLTRTGDREPVGANGSFDANGDFVPGVVTNLPIWEVTAQSVDDPFVSVAFLPRTSGKNAYAITRSGALFTATIPVTPPAVINWTRQNGFVPVGGEGVRHFVPHPLDENTVYAITKNSFARTSNAGANWTILNNPIPSSSYYSIVLDFNFVGGTELYLGTSDGVYKGVFPIFGPMVWTKWNVNLPNVKVVQLVRDDFSLYAVTYGRGLWRKSLLDNFGVSEILVSSESTVSTDQRFTLAFKWTHPERWRLLNEIELRIVDDQGTAIWVRFDEASNTLRQIDPELGAIGRPVQPGSPVEFATESAVMYLASSRVQGSGPTGPDVTLSYDLSFRSPATGRTFRVEVLATDDAGNRQGFEQIGSIRVQSGEILVDPRKEL